MISINLQNVWNLTNEDIIIAIDEVTKGINKYLEFRKNCFFDYNKFAEMYNDFCAMTSYWVGYTYVGIEKENIIKLKYNEMFSSFMTLLLFLKEHNKLCHKIERKLVSFALYKGPIYRCLGNGDFQTLRKIEVKYDNIYVSWGKNKNSYYLKSKLYGEYLILTANADEEQYGIDISILGIGRPNEEEVIFPTLKDKILNIEKYGGDIIE